MKEMKKPEMEVVRFSDDDVIATSPTHCTVGGGDDNCSIVQCTAECLCDGGYD